MIGIKTRIIILLLILLYSLPYFTHKQLYPFVAFNMFADTHTELIGISYTPYVVNEDRKILVNEDFNPWPIRRADIYNSVEAWVKKGVAQDQLASAAPHLLELSRQRHPKSIFKCYGIMRIEWPLTAPLTQRQSLMVQEKFFEYCDDI